MEVDKRQCRFPGEQRQDIVAATRGGHLVASGRCPCVKQKRHTFHLRVALAWSIETARIKVRVRRNYWLEVGSGLVCRHEQHAGKSRPLRQPRSNDRKFLE